MKNNLFIVMCGSSFLLMPVYAAQEELSPEQREQQQLMGIIDDFVQYGDALASFTKIFFGVVPHSFKHDQFKELAQNLLITINGIKSKSTIYQKAPHSKDTQILLHHLESLADLLSKSQEKLNTILQRSLGTRKLVSELTKLGTTEKHLLPKINTLRGKIHVILVKHENPLLKEKFDKFIHNIEYSFIYPQKNKNEAFTAAVRHSSRI